MNPFSMYSLRRMTRSRLETRRIESQEEEDGSGSKQQPPKKQRITATTTPAKPASRSRARRIFEESSDDCSNEEEEEESDDEESEEEEVEEEADDEDEDVDSDHQQPPPEENLKGRNPGKLPEVNRKADKNVLVPLSVILTDPDVFDCPICFENLTKNVYQCVNGHISCDSCCVKIKKKCPTCNWPIGYRCRAMEQVMEAIQVACVNAEHGCKEVLSFSGKHGHEDLCEYLPCSCPIRKCDFKGTNSKLYEHFTENHRAVNFRCKYRFSVSLKREKKSLVLREKRSGTLFVLKLSSVPQGNVISIVLIGPKSSSGNYRYELAAKDGEAPPMASQSQVESVPKLADYRPTRYFLVVEDGISQLDLDCSYSSESVNVPSKKNGILCVV